METRIGEATIEITEVKHTRTDRENDGDNWHCGIATVEWATGSQLGDVQIEVGCWHDTDDDYTEWCASNEGANAIERCFGGQSDGDSRGSFARAAFPEQCEEIGHQICRLLREAAVIAA